MFFYTIYGLNICSDYELDEAIARDAFDNIDVNISAFEGEDKLYDMTDEEISRGAFQYRYASDWCGVRFPTDGAFVIRDGNSISYKLYDGYERLYVNEIILCLALPIIMIQRQMPMLHGSGLVFNDKCFVVSGVSGAGKSTVTNALINEGAKFLADDTVALGFHDGDAFAYPAYPQQKLCPDQVTEKIKQESTLIELPLEKGMSKYGVRDINKFYADKKKLDALIVLNPTDKVTEPILEEITGAEGFELFKNNIYQLAIYKRVGFSPDLLKKCLMIISKIKIYKLSRPLEGMTTDRQIAIIKERL
ncbi:hypothetical protein [Butyrivibrio sp. JL13D10]|uniref:hypothetical protein n=1 Tax=Butyrivibrio sp. JL13D10 TaxID=3236815 RepID=UPI0038B59C3E